MANSKKMRSMSNINTLSGRSQNSSHSVFMKISCLEMEKERLLKTRQNAITKIQEMDARIKEIETNEAYLFQSLENEGIVGEIKLSEISPILSQGRKKNVCDGAKGIKLRY